MRIIFALGLSVFCFGIGVLCGRAAMSVEVRIANEKSKQNELSDKIAQIETAVFRKQAELCDRVLINCQANYVRVIRGLEALETKCVSSGGAQ